MCIRTHTYVAVHACTSKKYIALLYYTVHTKGDYIRICIKHYNHKVSEYCMAEKFREALSLQFFLQFGQKCFVKCSPLNGTSLIFE